MAKENVKESVTPGEITEEPMSSNVTPVAPVSAEPTQEQLKEQLQVALASNDWKAVTKISGVIAKQQVAVERAEREAKEAEVIQLCEFVKDVIDEALKDFIADGTLDKADGVWYSYNFGDKASSIRLLAKQTVSKSTGGGGSATKKFAITTESMVAKYGSEPYTVNFKDGTSYNGTVAEYYEQYKDGNARYQLRMKLLKKEGLV